MKATKDHLLATKQRQREVELTDGSTVLVRSLTRAEALATQAITDLGEREDFIISSGLIDPVMTADEVAQWAAEAPAGDLTAVSEGIARVSGMMPDSGKEAYKSSRRRR